MKKIYLTLFLCILIVEYTKAQFVYSIETSYNIAGTYTDLGTGGSLITTANKDNANSAAQSIGFGFNYNGTSYTHFILNTNGFIKLGTSSAMTPPSATNLAYTYFNQNAYGGVFNSSNANDNNVLAPFNHDLDSAGSGVTSYRVQTTGTTGNRICTIQFKNVRDKNITDSSGSPLPHYQFNSMNFQIKMYEANRMIEFVYGNFSSTFDSSLFKVAAIGIKGSGTTQIIALTKSSSHEFHLAQFVSGNYPALGPAFGFGNNNMKIGKAIPNYVIRPLPDAGRIFRFLPKIANDAQVSLIYTKHADNVPYSSPHTIVGRITNVGTASTTGSWVRVNVSGVNSYTDSTFISALTSGSSVNATFNGYVPANEGTDIITVSLSNDNEKINNSKTWMQKVSHFDVGYADSSGVFSNFGWSSGSGIFASRFHVNGKRRISKVRAKIGFSVTNVNQTVFGIVVDASSNIIGRSPDYVISANDLGEWVEFDIYGGNLAVSDNPPPLVTNADYYAGLAVPASGYNPMSLQLEDPNRSAAYFYHGGVTSGGAYTDISAAAGLTRFRLGLGARTEGVSLKLENVTSLNDPSCALSNQTVEVTVTNLDTFAVDFSIDTLHLEVSSAGTIVQKHSKLINSGILEPDSSATFVITNNFDLSLAGLYNIKVEARQFMEVDTANNYKSFNVNVVDTPGVELKVSPDSVLCFGKPFTFTADPYTAGSIMYQWYVNGVAQGSPTATNTLNPTLVYGDVVRVDLITDHCTTGTFTIPSNEIKMKLNPMPRYINGITDADTVIEFTTKNYAIGINPGHSYLWRISGGAIVGDTTGAAVKVNWAGPNTAAFISVRETDAQNCVYDNILPVVIISIVGLNGNENIGLGEVYPNPADKSVTIPVFVTRSENIQLSLIDLSGKEVRNIYSGNISGNRNFNLSVEDLHEGLYFLKIRTDEGYEKIHRISVKH